MAKDAIFVRFNELRDKYEAEFGEPFLLGYGGPDTYEEAIDAILKCIEDGEPYDPRHDGAIPADAIF